MKKRIAVFLILIMVLNVVSLKISSYANENAITTTISFISDDQKEINLFNIKVQDLLMMQLGVLIIILKQLF